LPLHLTKNCKGMDDLSLRIISREGL